jgi:putative glycosyltransferase (TIGR04372 family)
MVNQVLSIPRKLPLFILAVPVVVAIHIIRPWLLVRWGILHGPRIGHFAANTELYLCERDAGINVPMKRYIDIFFLEEPICNQQLAKMWKRILYVFPAWWILPSLQRVNRLIPGGVVHEIGDNTQQDRDVHNLLDQSPPHLTFTIEEEAFGEAGLRKMGIPNGIPFVCLLVRDDAYLDAHIKKNWTYHSYRDSDISNYVLAAETLADRGYFVIRMGVKVRDPIKSCHSRVIDYAYNGMRSDFMDIYLGAKCKFCISTSSGFDAIPTIFRRPIVFVNSLPVGYSSTFSNKYLTITRHHFSVQLNRLMSLPEIFSSGAAFFLYSEDYKSNGIKLIENTPEDICDVVIEMTERINGTWKVSENDDTLQLRFWEIFATDAVEVNNGRPLHGKIRARFGSAFLRNSGNWFLG